MKLSDIFHAIRDAMIKLPRKFWVLAPVLLVTVLLLSVYIGSRPTTSEKSSPQEQVSPTQTANNLQQVANSETSGSRTQGKVPPRILDFLVGAVVASFILAAFISLNRRDLDWRTHHILLVGSVISVVSIALIIASFHLSDEEPGHKTVFLIAANFVAISLLVLAVCYVPKLIRAMQGIQSTFLKITALLCFAGAAGGLGYHLDHNGSLVLPDLGFVDVESVRSRPDDSASKPIDRSDVLAKPSTSPSAASVPPGEKVRRRAFHIGFIGDILLGIITANALHLAIASLVRYDAKDQDRPGQYFTFLALGILGGFAGATFLSAQAEKVAKSEVREIIREEVGNAPQSRAEQAIILPQAAETAKAVTDSLTRFEWPNDAELALMKSFGVVVKDTKKPVEKFSVDELVAATGSEFFLNTSVASSETTKKYTGLIIDQPNVPRTQGWTARMLRALSVIYEGTRLSKAGWYVDVRSDLGQLFFDAASGEQRSAGALLGNFAAFAAVISHDLNQPDWEMISRRLEWGTSGAKDRTRKAAGLAREIATYLKDGSVQPTSPQIPPPADTKPEPNSAPPAGASVPARPVTQQASAGDDRVALLRLGNALRAIPKEFLESLKASDTEKSALSSIVESAPSFTVVKRPSAPTANTVAISVTTPTPSPAAPPTSPVKTSEITVAAPTPSPAVGPASTENTNADMVATPTPSATPLKE